MSLCTVGDLSSEGGKVAVGRGLEQQSLLAGEAVSREPVASSEGKRSGEGLKQAWMEEQSPQLSPEQGQGAEQKEKGEEDDAVAQETESKVTTAPQLPGEGVDPAECQEQEEERSDELSAAMEQAQPAPHPPDEKTSIGEGKSKPPGVAMSARTVFNLLKEEEEKEESLCVPAVSVYLVLQSVPQTSRSTAQEDSPLVAGGHKIMEVQEYEAELQQLEEEEEEGEEAS